MEHPRQHSFLEENIYETFLRSTDKVDHMAMSNPPAQDNAEQIELLRSGGECMLANMPDGHDLTIELHSQLRSEFSNLGAHALAIEHGLKALEYYLARPEHTAVRDIIMCHLFLHSCYRRAGNEERSQHYREEYKRLGQIQDHSTPMDLS